MNHFKAYLHSKGYSGSSVESIAKVTGFFTGWCEREGIAAVSEAGHNDVMAWMQTLSSRGAEKKTVANYVSHVKKYFDYLISEGSVRDNPCSNIAIKGIKRKVVYDIIPLEELELLYRQYATEKAGDNSHHSHTRRRNKAMLGLLIYQGLRSEELMRLEVADLKLREGKIAVAEGRRSAGRTMQLEAHQIFDLMDYTNDTRKAFINPRKPAPALFLSAVKGEAIESNTTHQLLKQLQQLNPKITSLNQLRASVIVQWLKLHNLRKVQHLAGHRYISSTEAYQSNNLEDLKEDIGKYHPF